MIPPYISPHYIIYQYNEIITTLAFLSIIGCIIKWDNNDRVYV